MIYKYKKRNISTFGEKPAALVNGHELSGKNFDPASSMQFDSSCSFLYFSSLAVSKVIHGIWIRLHHAMPWCNLVSSHQIFRFNSTQSRVYTLTVTSTIINGVGIAKHNCFLGWVRDAWAENALWQPKNMRDIAKHLMRPVSKSDTNPLWIWLATV